MAHILWIGLYKSGLCIYYGLYKLYIMDYINRIVTGPPKTKFKICNFLKDGIKNIKVSFLALGLHKRKNNKWKDCTEGFANYVF